MSAENHTILLCFWSIGTLGGGPVYRGFGQGWGYESIPVRVPRVAVWENRGDEESLQRAKAYATKQQDRTGDGYFVAVTSTENPDPLGSARKMMAPDGYISEDARLPAPFDVVPYDPDGSK